MGAGADSAATPGSRAQTSWELHFIWFEISGVAVSRGGRGGLELDRDGQRGFTGFHMRQWQRLVPVFPIHRADLGFGVTTSEVGGDGVCMEAAESQPPDRGGF